MAGMLVTGQTAVGSYGSRTVTISVSGMCNQALSRTGNYTVRVPFNRMSQAMRHIVRQGATIEGVAVSGAAPAKAAASDAAE